MKTLRKGLNSLKSIITYKREEYSRTCCQHAANQNSTLHLKKLKKENIKLGMLLEKKGTHVD